MKKNLGFLLFGLFLLIPFSGKAQMDPVPFFEKGVIRIQTTELDALADTIAIINHRADDIVWSRIVYKIVDMRDKQNYQLYFPSRPNSEYKSLFRLMLDAICDDTKGVNVYRKNVRELKPSFTDADILDGDELSSVFMFNADKEDNLIQVDTITQSRRVEDYRYMEYVKNQVKFLVQEVYFFNKHTSRMYSKIMSIAPLYPLHPYRTATNNQSMQYFQESILCWIVFDDLRPFLSKQMIIPRGNDTQRLTYDDFFSLNLYGSYVLGDSNMYNRMLLDYGAVIPDPKKFEMFVKKEQKRIETELNNFEMDIWEY